MFRTLILITYCLLVLIPIFSEAQNDTAGSIPAQTLEEVTINVVRAQEDAPVPQVNVNLKEIESVYQGQDGAFLLDVLSPSLVSTTESGTGLSNYGSFRLRGIDQTRVNITLNGVPLNDMLSQGVFFSNFTDFGNSIHSVQIQRGVGTSTNGVASYAGSINFESASLTHQDPYAEIQLTGGSFNTVRATAEVSTGLMANKTSFYARISHTESDGYRYNSGTNSNSFFFSGGYFGEKHAFKLTGFAGRSRNELAFLAVPQSLIKQDPRTNLVSPNDRDDFGQWLFQLQHTFRLATHTSLVTTAYYGGAGGDYLASYFDSTGFVSQTNFPLYNDHYGLMSFVNYESADRKTVFSGGLHGYTFRRNNREYIVPFRDAPYYNDQSAKDELSGFIKASRKWGNWEFYGDLQLRGVQISFEPDADFIGMEASVPDRNYLFVNPRVGATYRFNQNWQAYASFGRSGREPTRTDILSGFSLNAGNLPIVQNTDTVSAEFVNDFEAGLRLRNETASLELNYFYMAFENEIAPIGADLGFGQFVRQNQAPSYRTGVELNGIWQFAKRWELRAQATYMQAAISSYSPGDTDRVYEDVTPILSPEWNLRGTLEYEITEGLRLFISARYLSESYLELTNDENLTVPSSLVFNSGLNWNFWREHQLSIQFNNITDELYYTAGQVAPGGLEPAYYVQPPRHIYATLSLRF